MRILLLGELSGVHQELRRSLQADGHEVVTGHSRLATAEFPSDIPLFRPSGHAPTRIDHVREMSSQLWNARRLTGFDIVQLITPKFFNWKIHGQMMRFLRARNKRLVVINTSCGSDYHRQVGRLAYSPCAECKKHDLKADNCIYDRADEQRAEHVTFAMADAIVATSYEYAWALEDTPFRAKVSGIPLPIDISRHRPAPWPQTDRVRIWYASNRYGMKGGVFIEQALEKLRNSPVGNQVEIIHTPRLPYDEYLRMLDSVHVVIDQASAYGTGMNGLYALAHGRVTLSGAEPEELAFAGIPASESPVINTRPDPEQICSSLEQIVEDRVALEVLGRRSSDYVARHHASSVVARRYLVLYRRLLEREPVGRSLLPA